MDVTLSAFKEQLRDRYDIDRLVGRGGMADVYLATDRKHGRPVAVKILHSRAGVSVDSARFTREIETAARLQHPNILPVYDSGEAAGCLFFVMPYVEGGSLRRRLEQSKAIPWADALAIVQEVGDALAFAHTRNVVHRDVKPENILFFAGHAVVADFGIAKAISEAEGDRLTLAGYGLGTPEYMSPEQAFGDSSIDARSDVYSLACVLYEMLSGRTPWEGEEPFAALLRKSRESAPTLSGAEAQGLPHHVEQVLQRALERDPAARYADIPEMMSALIDANNRITGLTKVFSSATTGIPSVAVLPFVNLGGDASDEYLCDGLSEELIQALGQRGNTRVVARTSSFRFKGHTGDIRTVGKELAVDSLLEGSVRRQGNRLRISARLIDSHSGFERWSERFDRQFEDVFEVQDEIARSIVMSLQGTLQPNANQMVRAATSDMEAYELFLEARFMWNQRTTASLRRSVELLRKAVAKDPGFAQAHAALADSCVTLALYGDDAPAPLMSQARESAELALRLKAGAAQAHPAFACVRALYDWNWVEAEQHFALATRGAQSSATAFQFYAVNLLVPLRRYAEAHAALARARAIDPLSAAVTLSIGVAFHYENRQEDAIREFQTVLVREPQFGMAYYFLGRAYASLGRFDAALESITRAEGLLGSSLEPMALRAVVLAMTGKMSEANALREQLKKLALTRYVSHVINAEILAAMGRDDDALTILDLAVKDRATDLVWIGSRPAFGRLLNHPRFVAIMQTMRLPMRT
ncbi:MAG: protein kinase [Gemmatimonadaceae bacterium]